MEVTINLTKAGKGMNITSKGRCETDFCHEKYL